MDGAALVKLLRDTVPGSDSSNYVTDDVLVDLNASYHSLEDAVCKSVGEKFFWDSLSATMTDGQSEYVYDTATNGNLKGVKKTLGVSVDFGGTGNFVKCEPVNTDLLSEDPSYYETNQSFEDPRYEIRDNSLFIYPVPTDGVSVIRHYVTRNLIDLTATTAESGVFNGKFPISCHHSIVYGARYQAFLRQGDSAKASQAMAEFEKVHLPKVISYANTRDVSAKRRQTPA